MDRPSEFLSALTTPPVYCYAKQINEVLRLCRRIYAMTPMHGIHFAEQIDTEDEKPVFFLVVDHPEPVPQQILDYLKTQQTTFVRLETRKDLLNTFG